MQGEDYFCDIREIHKDDTDSAPDSSSMQLHIRYEKFTEQERTALKNILKKSPAYKDFSIEQTESEVKKCRCLESCPCSGIWGITYVVYLTFFHVWAITAYSYTFFQRTSANGAKIITVYSFNPINTTTFTVDMFRQNGALFNAALGHH